MRITTARIIIQNSLLVKLPESLSLRINSYITQKLPELKAGNPAASPLRLLPATKVAERKML